jgi:hypothetical protein
MLSAPHASALLVHTFLWVMITQSPHASALLVGIFVGYDISDIQDGWLFLLQGECGKIHPWICNNTPTRNCK